MIFFLKYNIVSNVQNNHDNSLVCCWPRLYHEQSKIWLPHFL